MRLRKRIRILQSTCWRCGGKLTKAKPKQENTLWSYIIKCSGCGFIISGRDVPNNSLNPFYFSIKSLKYRRARLKELGLDSYQEFLKSEYWQNLKDSYDLSCVVCAKKGELHHRTYRNLGREKKVILSPFAGSAIMKLIYDVIKLNTTG